MNQPQLVPHQTRHQKMLADMLAPGPPELPTLTRVPEQIERPLCAGLCAHDEILVEGLGKLHRNAARVAGNHRLFFLQSL